MTDGANFPNDATIAQINAADPARSTWVSANAGSGKTRVLTDRVARLLLQNVPPQKILCLTYTKAAASHMQNQLFERLGGWSMLDDAALRERLSDLGEDATTQTPESLRLARTLFAQALETPGGLKIQTIHSFCAALLRRFPLEAGVSPQFREMDERSGKRLRGDILEGLAEGPNPAAFDGMARFLSGDDPDKFALEITRNRDAFLPGVTSTEIQGAFDLPEGYDEAAYLSAVLPDWAAEVLPGLRQALLTGGITDNKNAAKLVGLDWQMPTMKTAAALEDMFVYGPDKKNPNTAKTDRFPTKDVRETHPDLMEAVNDLMVRFQDERPHRLALMATKKAIALHQFAQAFLPEYDRAKQLHGWLDFDDLILKARDLLTESSMAQWVLFKLDGGIDHILVDEAQDTSPQQWAVIARLAEEFLAGEGARDINRTLFVVGDEKQSIYSFQGADPAAFDQMRHFFETSLAEARNKLNRSELLYSFRSSSAILSLVDLVFGYGTDADISVEVEHKAFHSDLPGRVDLWPFLEKPEAEEKPIWYEPLDMPLPDDPALKLAAQIADAIKSILDSESLILTTKGNRRIVPGDFLILVQRRSNLFHELIKALKDRHLPVAGADRLKIGGELAVKDLTALLSFMATPEDDLSLAAALRSPLFGVTERDLFHLAQGRKGFLWQALRGRQTDFSSVFEILNDLLKQADFLRPYELLERILTRHKGRENLIARLGHEAEDGIDALLIQAMQYEQMEPPSLTGFLGWMSTDESDIKRQMDTKSSEIRVMTVHGAKGLESPIVILPDTAKRKPAILDEVQHLENGLAVWKSRKSESPATVQEAMDAKQQFLDEERMRLLYVALTRAENWLIVCGAGNPGDVGESWYRHVETGLQQLGTRDVEFLGETIIRYETAGWASGISEEVPQHQGNSATLADWVRNPAPKPIAKGEKINPSNLGGAKIVKDASSGREEEAALLYGQQIHSLLEHLPLVAKTDWPKIANRIVNNHDTRHLLDEVTNTLENPELRLLFAAGTLAEVAITATFAGRKLDGIIDRLVISDDHILAVDFKSNAEIPTSSEDVPMGYLQQMGAYAAALSQIYPNHEIETAILWTKDASLMRLSKVLVTEAFKEVSAS